MGYFAISSHAINVYLHPAPSSVVPAHLDASHASTALARHLGLERFERLAQGDGKWTGALQDDNEGLVGSAPRDGLLVSMSEDDAKSEYSAVSVS